jgi:general secretion pathway protein E
MSQLDLAGDPASTAVDDTEVQHRTDAEGRRLGLRVPRLGELLTLTPRLDLIPFSECARLRCALLCAKLGDDGCDPEAHDERAARTALELLIPDTDDVDLLAWARTRFGSLAVSLVSVNTFDALLAHFESGLTALGSVAESPSAQSADGVANGTEVLDLRQIGNEDSPAVRFVNSTLYDALKTGASDIHLEMDPSGLNVKFRLDGVLTAIRRIGSPELAAQAISRIKVMSQLDIAERRVPQDGRLQISLAGRVIDVRVSIMPSIHGEDAVLRILDRRHLAETLSGLTLAKLGFDEDSAEALRALCRRPHGMVLVTGPTGSGKTTTLYAAIAETHLSRDKIITIEDPVEYQLPGVLQIPVNERKGLTFALGLRSILRHDPDKILVGEIRDSETAQIAVQSALTGHLVFTTVHANTVFDVVGRFEQFGIDAYTFSSAINGVLAQRLMRRLCPQCAVPAEPNAAVAGLDDALRGFEGKPLWRGPRGCEHCRGTGYSGRSALGELLLLTPELKSLIAARAPVLEIQAAAQRTGWRPLRTLALREALHGRTSLEEVDRVAV